MQETWVWSLIWEDPTCCGAIYPCTTTTELVLQSHKPQLLKLTHPRACALQQEKPLHCNQRGAPTATTREKPEQRPRPSRDKNQYNYEEKWSKYNYAQWRIWNVPIIMLQGTKTYINWSGSRGLSCTRFTHQRKGHRLILTKSWLDSGSMY